MRPIILDMNEMSDSSEIYESRPHPFFTIFIYMILTMVIIAGVWAACFELDIVVKGTGMITAREATSVVTNTYAGAITKCNIADGQKVEKGDILYEVEAKDLDLQLENYQEQQVENNNRIEMLEGYMTWLSDNSVDMSSYFSNPYYEEYAARQKIIMLQKELTQSNFDSQKSAYDAKLASGSSMLQYYEDEINKLNQLSIGIRTRVNSFEATDSYYYAKLNNYITQYNNTVAQYDATLATLQRELDDAKKALEDAKKDINSAEDTIRKAEQEINAAKDRIAKAQQLSAKTVTVSMPIALAGGRDISVKCLTEQESEQQTVQVEEEVADLQVAEEPQVIELQELKETEESSQEQVVSVTEIQSEQAVSEELSKVPEEMIETESATASMEQETSVETYQEQEEKQEVVESSTETETEESIQVVDTSADEALIESLKAEIAAAETKKATAEAKKETQENVIQTKQDTITTTTLQKKTALSNLETETIAGIEASILSYQQNMLSAHGTQVETQSAQNNMLEQGTTNSTENAIQTEIQTVSVELSNLKDKQKELEGKIAELQNGVENTVVKAPMSGVINLNQELVEGNYLASGTQVMTVIPDEEDGFLVKSYIDNQDIAKIQNHMDVKYEVAAYPSSEYGTMTGEVEFVSADLKANSEDGSAYYVVETSIDNTNLYNETGDKLDLKVGMYCETKIIVEQKSVLKILLQKINLLD